MCVCVCVCVCVYVVHIHPPVSGADGRYTVSGHKLVLKERNVSATRHCTEMSYIILVAAACFGPVKQKLLCTYLYHMYYYDGSHAGVCSAPVTGLEWLLAKLNCHVISTSTD